MSDYSLGVFPDSDDFTINSNTYMGTDVVFKLHASFVYVHVVVKSSKLTCIICLLDNLVVVKFFGTAAMRATGSNTGTLTATELGLRFIIFFICVVIGPRMLQSSPYEIYIYISSQDGDAVYP